MAVARSIEIVLRVRKEVPSVDASNVAIDLITEVVFVLTVHHL